VGLKDLFGGIKDPVRGTGQVVSASMYRGDGIYQRCSINLVVQAEGIPATAVQFEGLVHRSRWPVPGMVLPVTVDRVDHRRVKIEWDEVPSSADRSRHSAENLATMMRGEGGASAAGGIVGGVTPTVVNLSGRDLSQLSDEQKAKLRMLGIDPDALAAAQGVTSPPPPPQSQEGISEDEGEEMDERLARLERLAKLREQGILNDAEFEAQKRQILDG
jgi:Short C-terminal domain